LGESDRAIRVYRRDTSVRTGETTNSLSRLRASTTLPVVWLLELDWPHADIHQPSARGRVAARHIRSGELQRLEVSL
jgi:hypothetical protein